MFRKLTVAVALAAIVSSVSTALVAAEPIGPADPGVRCAAKVGPGMYEFYLPGEKATDVNGNKWVCGPDGQWFRDYSAIVRAPITTLAASTITTQTAVLTR